MILSEVEGMVKAATWSQTAQAMGVGTFGLVAVNFYCLFWFILKALGVVFVQMWLRWTLPRIRIDQVLYTCVKVMLPASLIMLAGVAVWVAFVPTPTPPGVSDPLRLGHLVGEVHVIQATTQAILTLIGLAIFGSAVAVILWAFVHRDRMPRKTFFPDIMPVGNQVAYTLGDQDEDAVETATEARPA